MEYVPNGDLLTQLKEKSFSEEEIKYIGLQLVTAIETLQNKV